MIQQTDVNFRKYFLMQFTKELMRATGSYKDSVIKSQVNWTLHENKEPPIQVYKTPKQIPLRKIVKHIIKQKVQRDTQRIEQLKKEKTFESILKPETMRPQHLEQIKKEKPFGNFFKPNPARPPTMLNIPDLALPPTVQYIHPVPGQREVDLGKLNPLVKDPFVRTIECNGPGEKIVVTGLMGRKNTNITLTKEDINNIINEFSLISRIPAQEGFFKVALGRLVLSAIVSKVVSSKFIISKIREPYYFNR